MEDTLSTSLYAYYECPTCKTFIHKSHFENENNPKKEICPICGKSNRHEMKLGDLVPKFGLFLLPYIDVIFDIYNDTSFFYVCSFYIKKADGIPNVVKEFFPHLNPNSKDREIKNLQREVEKLRKEYSRGYN